MYFARILCWKQIMTILLVFMKVESDRHGSPSDKYPTCSRLNCTPLLKSRIYDFTSPVNLHYISRYTVISPGYKIPGYFSELSSGKYTAQFKNFTTARMHRHMYGFQWHFGVIFPSQDTIWSIILFTMYYFTAINIFISLHYTEILNSIIIPSIPYRTRHARSLSLRATQFWEKTNSQQTLTYDNFLFLTDLLIQHSPDL